MALVMRVGSVNLFGDFSDFQRDCQVHTPDFDMDRNVVHTRFDGKSLTLEYDGSLLVDNEVQAEKSDNVWPWISENNQELRYWRDMLAAPQG